MSRIVRRTPQGTFIVRDAAGREVEVSNASAFYEGLETEPSNVPAAKGTYWNPATGEAGQAAPPAKSVELERAERLLNDFRTRNYHLSGDDVAACVEHFGQVAAEYPDASPEQCVAEVERRVLSIPGYQRPANEQVWRANKEVERLQAERQGHGMKASQGGLRQILQGGRK